MSANSGQLRTENSKMQPSELYGMCENAKLWPRQMKIKFELMYGTVIILPFVKY